jgi:hypothetical protein
MAPVASPKIPDRMIKTEDTAMSRRHANVINIDEVRPRSIDQGRHFLTVQSLGAAAGSRQLGAALTIVPPGHISFAALCHFASEEAFYPDSSKVNVFGADSSSAAGLRHLGIYCREDGKDFSGYWDREPEAGDPGAK